MAGVCTAEQPPWVIFEHPDMGDLAQYLQYRTSSNLTSNRIVNNVQVLSYGCLIYMAMQIAAGAKYLESKNVVHKDLAARLVLFLFFFFQFFRGNFLILFYCFAGIAWSVVITPSK